MLARIEFVPSFPAPISRALSEFFVACLVLDLPKRERLDNKTLRLASSIERFSADSLVEVTEQNTQPAARQISLRSLQRGCSLVRLPKGAEIPDCAVESVVPWCPIDELALRTGRSCDESGDLLLANCPEASTGP